MSEVTAFAKQQKKILLQCGKEVTVETPTLRWWFEFLIPKQNEMRWESLNQDLQRQVIGELKEGKISAATLQKVPFSMLNIVVEVMAYYTTRSLGDEFGRDWILDTLDINDGLAMANAWLSVVDVKQAMHFFAEITKQIPVADMQKRLVPMLTGKGTA